MNRFKGRVSVIAIIIVVIAIIVGIGIECRTLFFTKKIFGTASDTRRFEIDYENLPALTEVERIVEEQKDVFQEIENIHPGFIYIKVVSPSDYPGKGYIVIEYPSEQDRLQIEELIGTSFFGVPWKGFNY
ncbi:MAG: hypothetical protein GX878_04845 [Firmicutes bacterium]|nr:hypothetical protein [Bacillota bacterium]